MNNPNLPSAGQWHTIDLTPVGVPVEAVAVVLSGILIITDGSNSFDTGVGVGFRKPGTTRAVGNYVMQACAIGPSGGARSNGQAVVPCTNGCIDWFWYRGNSNGEWPANPLAAQWPTGASYGFNLTIQEILI